MGIFTRAAEAAESASGAQVATAASTAVYGLSSLPLSQIAAAASIVLSVFYLFSCMPRVFRTAAAIYRGLFHRDWSLWKKLGNQPAPRPEE